MNNDNNDNNEIEELEIGLKVDNSELKESIDEAKNIIQQGVDQFESILKKANLGVTLTDSLNKNIKKAINDALKSVSQSTGTVDIKANVKTNLDNSKASKISNAASLVSGASTLAGSKATMDSAKSTMVGAEKLSESAQILKSVTEGFEKVISQLDGVISKLSLNTASTTLNKYTGNILRYKEELKQISQKIKDGVFTDGDINKANELLEISRNIVKNKNRLGEANAFEGLDSSVLDKLNKELVVSIARVKTELQNLGKVVPAEIELPVVVNKGNVKDVVDNIINVEFSAHSRGVQIGINEIIEYWKMFSADIDDSARRKRAEHNSKKNRAAIGVPTRERVIEEQSVMNAVSNLGNAPEGAIALLKVLDDINQRYGQTISTIKGSDLSRVLNNQFDFAIDGLEESGNNLSNILEILARDLGLNFRNTFEELANGPSEMKLDLATLENNFNTLQEAISNAGNTSSTSFNQVSTNVNTVNRSISQIVANIKTKLSASINGIRSNLSNIRTTAIDRAKTGVSNLIARIRQLNNSRTDRVRDEIDKVGKVANNSSNMVKNILNRLKGFLGIFAVFSALKNGITNAMDSIETESKFSSIFGSQAKEMSKWINQLNKELGVNVTSMMDYTSTLYGMGINLGFTTDKAVQFSKDLSMLSQDMASFYNISGDEAFNKLRSYMAGSTEVLYDFGVVATEANLQTFALSQGITKSYSSMSQAEKSMLRYQFAMQGLSQASQDLANTIKSPSNQARLLKESLNQLSVALGKCFIPILTVVLPILNTFVQALTTTINAIANFISQVFALFGVQVDFGGISGAVNDMASSIGSADVGSGGLSDNLADGAASAKEIKKFLGGIDELNIVTTKQDSGGGSGSGSSGTGSGGTGGINTSAIDKGLDQTETKFSEWANKVANALKLVWTSLSAGWNSVSDYIDTSIANLKKSFSNLGKAIESFLVGCWENGGKELVYNIGRLAGAVTGLALDISSQVVDAVSKLFNHLNPDNNPNTRKFINAMNQALVACQNFALSAGGWLQTFLSSGGQAFLNVLGDIAMLIGSTLVNAFANCINWITKFMNSWAGQLVIKTVALSLDVVAGAIKGVMIAVEKLTPLWSGLLFAFGAMKAHETIQKALALTSKKLIDFGLKVASNIENLVVWSKNVITTASAFTKNLVKGLASATKGVVSFGVAMLKNAGKALASGIASISAYIAGLVGLDGAMVASTLAAGGLKLALDLLGIGLIVTAVIALVAAVIKIGNKFNWWSNIANWLGEKLGWVVDGVKKFFGWTGDNNVSEEFDDTTDSIEGMGDAFEETTDEIETTADRFGTVASKVNQHFASIGFDAGKLSQDLTEAEAMMNEKFSMMSKNAQDYLDAVANGNEEVLAQMSADSESYTQEILYSYQKLSENEKNTFYEAYGYIKGINDDWLDYSGLTYEQLMAKHASYSANIMKDETLTAQEKDKLIDEHLTKVNLAYEEELTALKKQKKEILNNSKLSDTERQRLLEDVNAKIIAKEQEKTGKVIDEIESVTDAQEKASKTQQESVKDATDAQVKALKDVDKALNDTKKTLSSFKAESDKIANNIPKAWSGIGKKISKEFSDAKTSISNTMSSLLTAIKNNIDKIKSSMSGMTTGISTEFNKSLNTLSNNIDTKFKSIVSNIRLFASQMKQAMNFNFPTPYLKMPHLSVTGDWNFEKKTVPKFKVNWYSSGGIFPTRTLIGVGDANKGIGNNPEAVLPLNVLWKELNKNFDLQNKQLISALSNSNQPINLTLNLDGQKLAKAQFESYKELTQLGVVDFSKLV